MKFKLDKKPKIYNRNMKQRSVKINDSNQKFKRQTSNPSVRINDS